MKFLLIAGIAMLLSACTANMQALGGKTQRGFIDRSSYKFGEVLLWDSQAKRLQPLAVLRELNVDTDDQGTTDRVNFSTEVKFGGNIDLTAAQIDALQGEVTSRTTATITNFVTQQFFQVRNVFEDNWDAEPDKWRRLTEISVNGWPADGSPIYVVVIDDQTLAKKWRSKSKDRAQLEHHLSLRSEVHLALT
ncbi:hypothetical protein QTO30_15475 [Yoonia sp. GPGPB17]|uniref:hypothetical protein n=1 Tax=Yoonia sp. GPGPB17 TaxID=3026147 RepID=UPI0030BA6A05